jgi:beta-lactamase class A
MAMPCDRRSFLAVSASALIAGCATRPARNAATSTPPAPSPFQHLEARLGGRVGVFALDTGSGRSLAQRADERFAMCSTFKWLLCGALLVRVDAGQLSLEQRVTYGAQDLLQYAPVTRENVARGAMSVEELASAAIGLSDNTAANLLLALIGGPDSVTRFAYSLGDRVTRLDRNEPSLNTNIAGDPRDSTTPRAMALDLKAALDTNVLSAPSRRRLTAWLEACRTGGDRLRAGLPASFRFGHKTGTGENGAFNDVGVVWPPGRAPIVIAAYSSESPGEESPERDRALARAHAEIASITVKQLVGS